VRLPLSLKAQLDAMAQREGQDLSAVIRRLMQHALEGSQVSGTGAAPLSVDHPAPAARDQDTWAQIPSRQSSKQVSGPAPLQAKGFTVPWREYRERFRQGSPEVALPPVAPPPAAPEPCQPEPPISAGT
jgi:hypothetical protein